MALLFSATPVRASREKIISKMPHLKDARWVKIGDTLLNATVIALFISLLVLVSCSVGPSYHPPVVETPTDWKNEKKEKCGYEADEDGELVYLDYWWQVFDDQKLEELERIAIENNKNLYVAYERIQEARSLAGIAASAFYPQMTLNPQTTNTVELIKNYVNPATRSASAATSKSTSPLSSFMSSGAGAQTAAGTTTAVGTPFRAHEVLYFLPLNMSYEVDLWGKIRDQYDAAVYNWFASRERL